MMLFICIGLALLFFVVLFVAEKWGQAEYATECKKVYKMYSFWFSTLGTALSAAMVSFPQIAIDVWNQMPQEFKANIPPHYMNGIGTVLMVLGICSKFVKQKKLEDKKDDVADSK